jgi:hypothetical protein
VKHQRFVGTGYFDAVATVVSSGQASTCALAGSTEAEQFEKKHAADDHSNGQVAAVNLVELTFESADYETADDCELMPSGD